MATASSEKILTIENLNPCIKVMEYAVRGPLVIRATEIEKELEKVRQATQKKILLSACFGYHLCPLGKFPRQGRMPGHI